MRARKRQAGFSLLELIIAISLASLVLIAVTNLAASAVRFQMEGIRKGSVTGWSLISFMAMSRELENGNVLVAPSTAGGDLAYVCNNWSRLMAASPGARLDTNNEVELIAFCYDPTTKQMWRYYNNGAGLTCPSAAPAITCSGSVPAGFATATVIAWNVERLSGQTVFIRDNTIGGVRVRYVVGEQAASTKYKTPMFTPFDVGLSMQKQYSDTSD